MPGLPTTPLTLSTKLPEIPEYITGAFVHTYLTACDASVKKRFDDLCKLRGIEIPNDNKAIRTEQRELFMEAL